MLKGAALRQRYYADPAHRPASDIDLAVQDADWSRASDALSDAGFRSKYFASAGQVTRHHHQHCLFRTGDGFEIDLHRRILGRSPWSDVDRRLWSRAEPIAIGGRPACTLSAGDHVFHACLHGVLPNVVSPVRWIVDVGMILRSGATIQWPLVVDEAEQQRCSWVIGAALHYLRAQIGLPIPQATIDRLFATPMPADDVAYFRSAAMVRLPRRVRIVARLRHTILLYRRMIRADERIGFLRWNRERWGGTLVRGAIRRILGAVAR